MTNNKTRNILLSITLIILFAAAGIWFASRQRPVPPIRHVILISMDTCRADHLSCYGYDKPTTPNIDELAAKGYLFSHTMTTIPLTLPAHTSMLTGTIPPYHGKHENKDPYFDPSHVTLAQLLKAKGYSTGAFIGAQILNGSFGLDRGFDFYQDKFLNEDDSERRGGEVNRVAFKWLDKQKDNPVFLFLHYYDPHDEYDPPEPFATKFKGNPYAGEIAYTDHCIGNVVAKLKSLKMYESSLIIVTGDHGELLGEHGEAGHMYFIYQGAMHVPMIYKLPGSSGGQKIDSVTGIVDIVPTVCDLLDIDSPAIIHGKSLAAYFSDTPPVSEDRYIYCESLYPTKYGANSLLGLVGDQWKYIQTTRPELYDLQKDPGELTNLVNEKPHRARILQDHLAQVLEETVRKETGNKDMPISAEAMKHLRSLGYVAGSSVKQDYSFDQSADDPKDLIGFHEEFRKVNHLLTKNENVDVAAVGDSLIKQRPQFFGSYNLLVGLAIQQKDYKNAIRFGEKALLLKPEDFNIHNIMGLAYFQSKQDQQAAKYFELALKFASKDEPDSIETRVQVHNQLAAVHSRQRRFALAIVQYRESLKLNGKQPEILNAFAQALLTSRNPAIQNPYMALELAKQACTQTLSKNPVYMGTLAVAYGTLKKLSEAINISERALALAIPTGDKTLIAKQKKQLYVLKRALADQKKKFQR